MLCSDCSEKLETSALFLPLLSRDLFASVLFWNPYCVLCYLCVLGRFFRFSCMTLVHYWAICPLIQWFSKAMTHKAGASDCVWAAISSPVLCWTTESPSPCLAAFPRRLVVTLSVPSPSKTMMSTKSRGKQGLHFWAQLNTSVKLPQSA